MTSWVVFPYYPYPNKLTRVDKCRNCCSVWFLCPVNKFTKCPWINLGGELQFTINEWSGLRSMNRRFCCTHDVGFYLGVPCLMSPSPRDLLLHRFQKIGFLLVSDFSIHTNEGPLWKKLDHEVMGGVLISTMPKQTCTSWWNLNLLLGMVFCAPWTNSSSVPEWLLEVTFNFP